MADTELTIACSRCGRAVVEDFETQGLVVAIANGYGGVGTRCSQCDRAADRHCAGAGRLDFDKMLAGGERNVLV